MCPDCGNPVAQCACGKKEFVHSGDGVVRIERSSKGHRGKTVTIITGIPLPDDKLTKLAKKLKQVCGAGGTVKDGTIEIQGDHADRLTAELQERGYTVKRKGG